MNTFTHNFEIKSVGEETTHNGATGIFVEGYCAVWEPRDRGNDNWQLDHKPGSTTYKAIEAYFKRNPIVLFNHGLDPTVGKQALGQVVEWKTDNYGIWVRDFIQKPAPGSVLSDVYEKIKSRVYRTFSIAGKWLRNAKSTIVELVDMLEHSVVSIPMQPLADFTLAKSLELSASSRGVGMETQEALQLANDVKAGRMISQSNKDKIQQAVLLLQELITEVLENPADESPMEDLSEPFELSNGKEAQAALVTLKGALATMDAKDNKSNATPQPENGSGNGDTNLMTEMLTEWKQLKEERKANEIATQRLEVEKAKQQAEAEAKQAEDARIKDLADVRFKELLAGTTIGQKMQFGGGNSNQWQGKNVYQNNGKEEFSFAKFAQQGLYHREYDYMEKMAESYGQKTVNETIGNQGGFLVPTQQSTEIVDLLRARAVVRRMPGVRMYTMTGDKLTVPRLTSSVTASTVAEAGTMTATDPGFGQIVFVAKKIYALVRVTKEMLNDSNPSVEQIIRDDIAAQLALKEDNDFLQGSGVGDTMLGITQTSGIGTFAHATAAASAGPERTSLVKAAALVRSNNGTPNGVVMNSRISDYLSNVKDTAGQPAFDNVVGGYRWNQTALAPVGNGQAMVSEVQFGSLMGMLQGLSNQLTPAVSSTTGATGPVIVGDWRYFAIADRSGIEIEVDRSVGFLTDTVYIKATKRVDCALTIPGAFTVITSFSAIDIA